MSEVGFLIDFVDVNSEGLIDPHDIETLINDETFFVSIMHANNEIGTIQPIDEIGCICRKNNIIFHSDCVQAVPHLTLDVQKSKLDMISFSAHKFHGPKGIGVLYCNKKIPLTPVIYGGAQERGKRGGTEDVASIVGMAAALKEVSSSLITNEAKIRSLRDQLESKLLTIENSHLNGSKEKRLSSIINIRFDGVDAETLLLLLDNKGICISTGSACSSGSIEPSPVLLAMNLSKEEANNSIRISLSRYNSESEIQTIYLEIKEAVRHLRSFN